MAEGGKEIPKLRPKTALKDEVNLWTTFTYCVDFVKRSLFDLLLPAFKLITETYAVSSSKISLKPNKGKYRTNKLVIQICFS